MIIAIDGPAGSGKSTTARAISRALGFPYVDTGAMYRAFGLAFLRAGAPDDQGEIDSLIENTNISLSFDVARARTWLNDEDVTEEIRTSRVSQAASFVAKMPDVRKSMVKHQRAIAEDAVRQKGGAIVEGRDIGTVVFPNADLKIFLDADLDERARRRMADMTDNGVAAEEVREALDRRDTADKTRAVAPLQVATDAHRIDTTNLTFEQQVSEIIGLARNLIH